MPRFDRVSSRLVLIAVLAAALGLGGCGRKGPLDPPPSASIAPPPGQGPAGAAPTSTGEPAPQGQRKSMPLDWLLN